MSVQGYLSRKQIVTLRNMHRQSWAVTCYHALCVALGLSEFLLCARVSLAAECAGRA